MSNLSFPVDTYRWLVSIDIIPNEGILTQKNLVAIPPNLSIHFQSGFNIGQIVAIILRKSGEKAPSCLENVKPDNSKSTRLTNWNFIWLSFDDLKMQFDNRIKDLILQGETSLIGQIVKQLCQRDENKSDWIMKNVPIREKKVQPDKAQKAEQKNNNSLDIKKLNLQKNPQESQSSLQFLILLLGSSLHMSTQQILGLFTNQNKYLAHIIAKGINQDFTGIILFYTLLNKYGQKLKNLYQLDKKDAESCLYAIKPGFISKNVTVSQLTIQVFSQLKNIYQWFVSEEGRGAATLFLGIRRHPQLINQYWQLFASIILNQQVQFFTTHFKKCFRDSFQLIEISLQLMKPLSQTYLISKLTDIGIIAEWLQISVSLFEDPLQFKLLAYQFVGQVMICYPQGIQMNQDCLNIFKKGWKDRKITQFIFLIDQVIIILEKLAEIRNPMARKMYLIIIQIFEILNDQTQADKKQYLVTNFIQILPKLPGVPSQYLIEAYQQQTNIRSSDYLLIKSAINTNADPVGLARIGQIILKMFINNAVVNCYQGPLIYNIAVKIIQEDISITFIRKVIKDCLNQFCQLQIKKKSPAAVVPQPMYGIQKGNSKKLSSEQTQLFYIKQKQSLNLFGLVQKLVQLSKNTSNKQLIDDIKQDLLVANAQIRHGNFKVGSKVISNLLQKKYNISKEQQGTYDQDYKLKKSAEMEQSMVRKKVNNVSILSVKAAPQHLRKQFSEMIQKRKRQQEQKKFEQQKKIKEEMLKKTQVKKQLEKINLLKGFGGQTQLKEEGFWSKILKQQNNKEVQLYHPSLIQVRDLQYIDNLFKKYHRLIRSLFLKYTFTMHNNKSVNSFQDTHQRTQTINVVQLMKFLKDYKLFFMTNSQQVQSLTRQVNIQLMNRRDVQQLDFQGFQQFLIQFSILNMVKSHTVSVKTSKGNTTIKKNYQHLTHCQLVEQVFNYLKQVFQQKGEKTDLFDQPQAAYFNETEIIKQFNKKLEQDPNFILPQGYKKITDKVITFIPQISQKNSNIKDSYRQVIQVLDEIFYQAMQLHILQPITQKSTKARVKPQAFLNIKPKVSQNIIEGSKMRILSTVVQRKIPVIPPPRMLQKKTLSFGMKLGLSYVPYKDKLLGQQVAYVLDDILDAVEKNKNTIEKEKIVNDIMKKRSQLEQQQRRLQSQRQRKRKQQRQKQISRQKKRKQQQEKYLAQQKKIIAQKRKKQQQEKLKKQSQEKKKKTDDFKSKQKFQDFNKKQIQKLLKNFQEDGNKKKKNQQQEKLDKVNKQQLYKKLRSKIQSQDQKVKEIKLKSNQQIAQLYHSPAIQKVFKDFEPNIRAIYDFLIKNTYLSLTQRKHNNQIIFETWHYFNNAFQLSPLIVDHKDIVSIFKSLTKDKQVTKQYYIGLNYSQFQQALLRCAIKHKSKIKQQKMTDKQINDIVQKDIQQKQKNEFQEPKQIDVKSLLKQQDVKKDIFYDYGDITKTNEKTIKALIYYLKVPKDKVGQDKRFRQILATKIKNNVKASEKLKQKLNEDYTLSPQKKKKPKNTKSNQSMLQSSVPVQQQQQKQDNQS